jgi:hypothetical protein
VKKIKSVLSTLRDVLDGARRDLDEIRDRIADLKEQRQQIETAPADRAEIERRVDALIERTLERTFHFPALSEASLPPFGSFEINQRFKDNPFAALCAFDTDRMRKVLLAKMPTDGLTAEERAAHLAKLDAELLASEVAEELTIREIEATGATMPRRANADPRVLLAPTEELQG